MSEPSLFRHYQIVQDAEGGNVELLRSERQVVVLAFDQERLEFVHCHVLLDALKNRAAYEQACNKLRQGGHPLLASMIEFGEDDENPFYITSCVDGETMRDYLQRHTEIPLWLAVMLTIGALDAAIVLSERGDYLDHPPLDGLRVIQTSTSALQVMVSDFRLQEDPARPKGKTSKAGFERQAKFLRAFLHEVSTGPTLPDALVPTADFISLLSNTLAASGPGLAGPMNDLRLALKKRVPDHLTGEVPASQKPRAVLAPLLATYQEVARVAVNLVRIQSQRLDMSNPYSMRGTLTRTGRPVLVEQVPPLRMCGPKVEETGRLVQKLSKKREFTMLVQVPLVQEASGITCVAEEVVEGVSLADLLRERSGLAVAEIHAVMTSLDAALTQLERANVPVGKLRLEDIFLFAGIGREDSSAAQLLHTKLTEWPSLQVMLRVHPTLSAMSGRGLNPGVLLPPAPKLGSPWHAGWLAALGSFLIGTDADSQTLLTLLGEVMAKAREGKAGSRSDLLAAFARLLPASDLGTVASIPGTKPKPETTSKPEEEPVLLPGLLQPVSPMAANDEPLISPLGMVGLPQMEPTSDESEENIGFAELLFQQPAPRKERPGSRRSREDFDLDLSSDWSLNAPDSSPWWLKLVVFITATMMAGALFAHCSGRALWQKSPMPPVSSKAKHP